MRARACACLCVSVVLSSICICGGMCLSGLFPFLWNFNGFFSLQPLIIVVVGTPYYTRYVVVVAPVVVHVDTVVAFIL